MGTTAEGPLSSLNTGAEPFANKEDAAGEETNEAQGIEPPDNCKRLELEQEEQLVDDHSWLPNGWILEQTVFGKFASESCKVLQTTEMDFSGGKGGLGNA